MQRWLSNEGRQLGYRGHACMQHAACSYTMRNGLSYVCLKCVLVSYVLSYESYLAVLS
jgi:hypothetical protein